MVKFENSYFRKEVKMKEQKTLKEIEEAIEIEKKKINGLCFKANNHIAILVIKEKNWKLKILEHSKKNLLNEGIYNEKRNCYYPSGSSNKDIAECNKLEKLFKKYGFKTI